MNADKVGQVVDTIGSTLAPAATFLAPIFLGSVKGGVIGAAAGVGLGVITASGQRDAVSSLTSLRGLVEGSFLGGLAGGISGAFGVSPLISAPLVLAGAALVSRTT